MSRVEAERLAGEALEGGKWFNDGPLYSLMLRRVADLLEPLLAGREWQSMESAPKGSGSGLVTAPDYIAPPHIILRLGDEAVSIAYWDWYYAEGGAGCEDGYAWIEPCSGEPLNRHYSTPPDGWLPTPPTKENG